MLCTTARMRRSSITPGTYSTCTVLVARFTAAFNTPGWASSMLSTLPTQLAQVMPVTGKVRLSVGTSYPLSRMAFTTSRTASTGVVLSITALRLFSSTWWAPTEGTVPRALSTISAQCSLSMFSTGSTRVLFSMLMSLVC